MAQKQPEQKLYTREALLSSKRFARYQRDFLAAVLSKPEYTMAEAEKAVKAYFGRSDG